MKIPSLLARFASFASTLVPLSLASCAGVQTPLVAPDQGGRRWTEVASAHFVLKTDLDADDAQGESAKLEDTFAALSDLGFASDTKPQTRIDVVHFRRHESYVEFAPHLSAGAFFPFGQQDFERRPYALIGGDFDNRVRETIQHELTHLFVRYYYPQVPVWLNEGMARYLETLTVDSGTATLGRAPRHARFWAGPWQRGKDGTTLIPVSEAPSPAGLVAMTAADFYADHDADTSTPAGIEAAKAQIVHYQAAWCLVHLLMEHPTYGPAFHSYLDRVHSGEPEASAWQRTIGQLDGDQLAADYKAALMPREVTTLRTKYAPPPRGAATTRPMEAAEVHVLWARLRSWDTEDGRYAALSDLADANGDPHEPDYATTRAHILLKTSQWELAKRELREAALAHPDDPRLWSALGYVMIGEGHASGASDGDIARALAPVAEKLAPIAKSAPQLDLLGRTSLARGNADEALAYEKRAVGVDPNCVECLGTAARAMLQKGLRREALEVVTLAQGLSPEGARPPWLATLARKAQASSP